GKAATHSIERSATYTCCSNMSTAVKKRGHEHKDVDVPSLFTIALLLFLSGALIFFVVWAMMHYFKLHELGTAAGEPNLPVTVTREFPGPRLQIKAPLDLARLRAAEDLNLHSYGWIDRNSRTVRIPIDRAVKLLLERGLP